MAATTSSARTQRLALGALVVGLLASLPFLVHPWYDPTNDGAMYIAAARSLLAGEGYAMLGTPFLIRPPGFPLMIAPLFAVLGTNFGALNLFVSLWGAVAVVLFYLWLRPSTGWPVAWLAAAALWLNPAFQRLCNQPMSDVPGVALLLGCLLLERRFAAAPAARRDLVLGLAIGASALVRSVCVLLLPAILVARVLQRGREPWRVLAARSGALLLGVLFLQGPWSVRNAVVAPPPPADQTMLYSYGTGMWHENKGDPDSRRLSVGEVLGRFDERSNQIVATLGNRLDDMEPGTGATLGALVLLAGLAAALVTRRRSADVFCLGVLALMAVYFNFAPRLLLPVYVLMFGTTVEVVRGWVARAWNVRGASVVTGLAMVAVAAVDLAPRRGWGAIERAHLELERLAAAFAQHLEKDDVVASFRGWHYAVVLERPVYSLQFGFVRGGGPEGAEELIDKYGIDKVILSPRVALEQQFAPWFRARYGQGMREAAEGDALIFRVR